MVENKISRHQIVKSSETFTIQDALNEVGERTILSINRFKKHSQNEFSRCFSFEVFLLYFYFKRERFSRQ